MVTRRIGLFGLAILALSSCDGGAPDPEADVASHAAAASSPAASNIGYAYTQLTSYPAGGLTATNVKDAIDQSVALGYGALAEAQQALISAKAYADAGDATTLAGAKSYADSGDATTLASANAFTIQAAGATLAAANGEADSGDAATLLAAQQFTTQALAAAGAPCTSSCQNSVTTVNQRDPNGNCVVHFRFPCDPYGCDAEGVTCRDSCVSSANCSQGAACNTLLGQCTTGNSMCEDPYTIVSADGSLRSCLPYRCNDGSCQQQCVDNGDCFDGYHCTASHCYAD